MKKLFYLSALLFVAVLSFNRVAFGWGANGGDGSNWSQLQETAVFLNVSGGTLTSGMAVILDTSSSDITTGTTLGTGVTTTTAADNVLAIGIVKSESAADDTPVVVVTRGPVKARILDSSDNVITGAAVGTSTTAGYVGGGTNLGMSLGPGTGVDVEFEYIWVDPAGSG